MIDLKKLAYDMIQLVLENTMSGNYHMSYDDLIEMNPELTKEWLCEHHQDVTDALYDRPEVCDADGVLGNPEEEEFDILVWWDDDDDNGGWEKRNNIWIKKGE